MFLCVPQVPKDLLLKIKDTILQRTVDGMKQEGVPYTGKLAGVNHCVVTFYCGWNLFSLFLQL